MLEFEEVKQVLDESLDTTYGAVETSKEGKYVFSWDKDSYEYDMYLDHFGENGVQLCIRRQKTRRTYFLITNSEYLTTEDDFKEDFSEAVEHVKEKNVDMEEINPERAIDSFF